MNEREYHEYQNNELSKAIESLRVIMTSMKHEKIPISKSNMASIRKARNYFNGLIQEEVSVDKDI